MNKIRVQLLKEKGRDGENRVTKRDREIEIEIEIDRYIYGERERLTDREGRRKREKKGYRERGEKARKSVFFVHFH